MPTQSLSTIRDQVRTKASAPEEAVLRDLLATLAMTKTERADAQEKATDLVERLRRDDKPGLMEVFLAEYGLSTDEGVALMCLAEALLRVPDHQTIDDLIEDKITSSSWGEHLGKSSSSLVNAATWGLLFTGKVLEEQVSNSVASSLRGAIKRLGEPVIRVAVGRAMKEMGRQFVLGESIEAALIRADKRIAEGYTYSFDMLGEAALTSSDATLYFKSYQDAIAALSANSCSTNVVDNSGISIKLSALHPRYEASARERVMSELVPRVLKLAQSAKRGNIGLNIDAEEAERLDLSLDVIEAVLRHPSLRGWDGFGVVVQAYSRSASSILDWVYALACETDRRVMVRLVKGAYWDTEIKRAQVEGVRDYPVFTRKAATDVSYLCCAKKLLSMGDRVFSQFATHNAHTAAAILAIADGHSHFEFQRLHGMGEGVFRMLRQTYPVRCRIYAPVGKHKDLLAYLVRRLLENGANSSFVNQIVDLDVPIEEVVADPFSIDFEQQSLITLPSELFSPERKNSRGWDLSDCRDRLEFEQARAPFRNAQWHAKALIAGNTNHSNDSYVAAVINPALPTDQVGDVLWASAEEVLYAVATARPWTELQAPDRANVLRQVAALLEQNAGEIFALLAREAGKTPTDAIAELREAVDFLRYYALQAESQGTSEARGVFVCISPWNFPLAIFVGQIAAALAAGNGVLAKPSELTPLIAFVATKLFYEAGVPHAALQLLPGDGANVGASLVSSTATSGVCFTGSTETGLAINRMMAKHLHPEAPLIAETGGLNAMIVDSTALPEQAVIDIVRSAFQSAGQRCSALRILYLQDDIYSEFMTMLYGAMDELKFEDPWNISTDIGPLISTAAQEKVQAYLDDATSEGRLLKSTSKSIPNRGLFVGSAVLEVGGIADMPTEIFGPVLHVAKYSARELPSVINELNDSNYGLTFGLHTRIDGRVEDIVNTINVGNVYVNRDQIGAVVGCQPFGGENLSGTGPKAGGPHYIPQFLSVARRVIASSACEPILDVATVQRALNRLSFRREKLRESELPSPTGESNKLYEYGRGPVLCLGPDLQSAEEQARTAQDNGCDYLIVCPGANGDRALDGYLPRELLTQLSGFCVVALFGQQDDALSARRSLAQRKGKIIPLICSNNLAQACRLERHVCVDTTAAGGNAALLAATR